MGVFMTARASLVKGGIYPKGHVWGTVMGRGGQGVPLSEALSLNPMHSPRGKAGPLPAHSAVPKPHPAPLLSPPPRPMSSFSPNQPPISLST